MLYSLKLENFKSHRSTHLEFGEGTNILLGRMGAGKSSVLDALCFALYGTFPRLSRRDQGVEDLITHGSDAPFAQVELEFEAGGKKYLVMRRIGKKLSDAELRCGGKLVQKGAKAVTDEISALLGVDYELFSRAIYSEQNRIDYLLSLNPRQRKAEIDWLLGLGQFDEAREAAQSAANRLSEHAQAFLSEASGEKVKEAKEKWERQRKEVDGAALEAEKLSGEVASLRGRLEEKKKKLQQLEGKQKEYETRKRRRDNLEGEVEGLKRQCTGRSKPEGEKIAALVAAYQSLQLEASQNRQLLLGKRTECANLSSSIAILENGLKLAKGRRGKAEELQAKISKALGGREINGLEKEVTSLLKEIESIAQLHASLHAQLGELSSAIDALSKAGAHCPVCDSPMEGGKAVRLSEQKQGEREKRKAKLAEFGLLLEKKKKELEELQRQVYDISLWNGELGRLRSEGTEIQKYESELEAKKIELAQGQMEEQTLGRSQPGLEDSMNKARAALEDAQSALRMHLQLEHAQVELAAAISQLADFDFSEEKWKEAKEGFDSLRLQEAKCSTQLAGKQQSLKLLRELADELFRECEQLERKAALASEYLKSSESMVIYKNSLAQAQGELRQRLVEEINAALAEIWTSIYPYSDYSGIKLEADGKDYHLLMEKSGWREADSVASGGERACVCLALRIAFATILTPDVGWLILDEPTHNLDADAVAMLSEAISSKIPSIVAQTFVITHEPSLGESGQGAVFQLERERGKNGPTTVGKLQG